MTQRDIVVGKTYRHFSGNYFRVICIAVDSTSQDNKEVVVYETLGNKHIIYTRPVELFNEKVDHEKYKDVLQTYKFEPIEEYN